MPRVPIPKKISDAVFSEYSHRCAICGSSHPHLHHVDEDSSNNDPENLLPLCPNCHLRDQHNPTRKIDIAKLKIFRRLKDPAILKPQFHPIFIRQEYLSEVESDDSTTEVLEDLSNELIEFVRELEMGGFYGKRLQELLGGESYAFVMRIDGGPDLEYERQLRQRNRAYRARLIANLPHVQELLVEMLRYQRWAHEA